MLDSWPLTVLVRRLYIKLEVGASDFATKNRLKKQPKKKKEAKNSSLSINYWRSVLKDEQHFIEVKRRVSFSCRQFWVHNVPLRDIRQLCDGFLISV